MIWSQILQLFHRNDHHIETTCRVQHLGCYREGQGHSMILHQNRVWPKTLLFEVRFYNYFWQTTSLCPIPIRGALPGSDRLLFDFRHHVIVRTTITISPFESVAYTMNYTNTKWLEKVHITIIIGSALIPVILLVFKLMVSYGNTYNTWFNRL